MSILSEMWAFLRTRKKLWLMPLLFTIAVFGAILILAQASAVAPFIYTLF